MKRVLVLLLFSVLSSTAHAVEPPTDLAHLSRDEYKDIAKETFKDIKVNPEDCARRIKTVLMSIFKLNGPNQEWSGKMFDVDANFDANTFLLTVATSNKIKRGKAFIDEYKRESADVSGQLKDQKLREVFDFMTSALIGANEKLSDGVLISAQD